MYPKAVLKTCGKWFNKAHHHPFTLFVWGIQNHFYHVQKHSKKQVDTFFWHLKTFFLVLTGHTSALDKWSLFVEHKIVDYCTSGLGSTEICLDILGLGLGLSDFIFIE